MALPREVNARRFYRAACQRLLDAEVLLGACRRSVAAVYLAGYAAVECIMKALLLAQVPPSRRPEVQHSFRGAIAHDLLWLRQRLARAGVLFPGDIAAYLSYVSRWTTDLRYEPGEIALREAQRFVSAAAHIVKWGCERM
jgi:hypothetical protein